MKEICKLYAVMFDFPAVYKYLQSLERLFPEDLEVYYFKGVVKAYRKEYAEAEKQFKKALKIDKEFTEAHYSLGNMYRITDRIKLAKKHCRLFIKQAKKISYMAIRIIEVEDILEKLE